MIAENITQSELDSARQTRKKIKEHLKNLIVPGSVLVIPTAPCIAPLIDENTATLDSFRANTMALTCIAGLGSLPQISMPVLSVEECPVGVSLVGAPGSDEQLMKLANKLA